MLYLFHCITKLKYHLYRPVSKYNLFVRHPIIIKKRFYTFFTQYKNESKKHILMMKRSTRVIFIKTSNHLI